MNKIFTMDKASVVKFLRLITDEELHGVYRECMDANNDYDNMIYEMDELDEILGFTRAEELAWMMWRGDFKPCDRYFKFDGYGNLMSFDHVDDIAILDDLADIIIGSDETKFPETEKLWEDFVEVYYEDEVA